MSAGRRACVAGFVTAALLAAPPGVAMAQTPYPSRTVKIVVPAPPGANLDTIPRIIADKLSARWGQPVIIEHRPGAAQNLGAEVVARSEPDGYTLLATPQGSAGDQPALLRQARLRPRRLHAGLDHRLAAAGAGRASEIPRLLAEGAGEPRRKDAKISFASAGIGASPRLLAEWFKRLTKTDILHVPYTGSGPALSVAARRPCRHDVRHVAVGAAAGAGGQAARAGVTTAERVPFLPDLPAIAEMYPGLLFDQLVRDRRAAEDAARDRRQDLAVDRRDAEAARRHRALPRAGEHAGRQLARPRRRRS